MRGRLYGDRDGSVGNRDETAARLAALGIDTPLYKSFPCILNEHAHSARVHPTTAGYWSYDCEGLSRGVGLAEIRALLAYGSERHLSGVEAARWRELLDFEAGLRSPIPIDVALPEPCPDAARDLAGAMRKFVGLRGPRFPPREPFVFAHEFAQAYSGLTGDRVREAKDWLERTGVIYRAGKHGRAILWKLAAQDSLAICRDDGGDV